MMLVVDTYIISFRTNLHEISESFTFKPSGRRLSHAVRRVRKFGSCSRIERRAADDDDDDTPMSRYPVVINPLSRAKDHNRIRKSCFGRVSWKGNTAGVAKDSGERIRKHDAGSGGEKVERGTMAVTSYAGRYLEGLR